MIMFAIASPMVSAAPKLGKGQAFPPPKLDGTRINLLETNVALPTEVATYVIHGWDLEGWKTRSKEVQRDFLENYIFELYIDGEWVELRSWKHYYSDQDLMKTGFYVEFDAGHFGPGNYIFRGVWRPGGAKENIVVKFQFP